MASLRDVARLADVSLATASRALAQPERVAPERRARVERAAADLRYRPGRRTGPGAPADRAGASLGAGVIGLLVPDLQNPFFAGVAKGVQLQARTAGLCVLVADTDENPRVEAEAFACLERQVAGVVLCSPRMPDHSLAALPLDVPTVLVNRESDHLRAVLVDNADGMRQALAHLHALGHRRIAYAGGQHGSWSDRQRRAGLETAARTLPDVEVVDLGSFPPSFTGGVAAGDLVTVSGATAVIAHNDLMALGIVDRLRQRGTAVPDRISVVGFDDVPAATHTTPALTTVGVPLHRLGRTAVELLLDESPEPEGDVTVPVSLVVRSSTTPLPPPGRDAGDPAARRAGRAGGRVTGSGGTPPRLSPATLDALPRVPDVRGPAVDPRPRRTGVVHLGIGAFHRAHQAVFTEDAAAATGDDRWGILGVTQRSARVVTQLAPQDGLYGVLTRGRHETSLRVVGAVRGVAFLSDETARVLDAVAAPATHVVTITVSEKGYRRAPAGGPDLSDPGVAADLAALRAELGGRPDDTPARTPIGALARGLARRRATHGAPLTVVCCDNMVDNGRVVEGLLEGLLEAAAAGGAGGAGPGTAAGASALRDWVATSVRFPATMVDRITPATTEADRADATAMLGLRDEALVVAEPFRQWVIEDAFAGPRPAWERAGATMTDDVGPFERAKLRLLNGTHSAVAYLGALRGHRMIDEALADPEVVGLAEALMDEAVPTLAAPSGLDLAAYRAQILERFANPAIGYRCLQVAGDGSQKLPIRVLGTAADRLAAGAVPVACARTMAAWAVFVARGRDVAGRELPLDDPLAARLHEAASGGDAGLADRMLAVAGVFPAAVRDDDRFRRAFATEISDLVRLVPAPSS